MKEAGNEFLTHAGLGTPIGAARMGAFAASILL